MSPYDKIFNYCERGHDPAFWAEPLNALTNAAFIIAALVAMRDYRTAPAGSRGPAEAMLAALTFVIGVGSFLFHTYATRWASLADIIPIALFMLAYVAYVLRRFIGLHWSLVGLGLAGFVACLKVAGGIECQQAAWLPITAEAGARCLNGTAAYAPAFIALAVSAAVLAAMKHPAWRSLVLAGAIFLASMTFRTLDIEICAETVLGGHARGTHFLWHVLNALTLYILLRAAIRYGAARRDMGVVASRPSE